MAKGYILPPPTITTEIKLVRRISPNEARIKFNLIASGHVHQHRDSESGGTRFIWAPSTAYVLPDTRQPRYGRKEVGYVGHRLRADGTHDSRFVAVPGAATLDIADYPDAYGPLD